MHNNIQKKSSSGGCRWTPSSPWTTFNYLALAFICWQLLSVLLTLKPYSHYMTLIFAKRCEYTLWLLRQLWTHTTCCCMRATFAKSSMWSLLPLQQLLQRQLQPSTMGVASNRQDEAIASSWNLPNKKRPG